MEQYHLPYPLTQKPLGWADRTESVIAAHSASPRVYTLRSGIIVAACEARRGITVMQSADGGESFRDPAKASFFDHLTAANPNLFELTDGTLLLSYRAIGKQDDGFYTSLQVSVSYDHGKTFAPHSTVAEYTEPTGVFRGVWEPCLGYLNGVLTCFYANDATAVTKMQNIEYKQWIDGVWQNRTVVSNGEAHNSRDGMPVWIPLKDGGYACVIESSALRDSEEFPFVIQLLYSKDGICWSEPYDIYYPTSRTSKAGAPGIALLPDGRIVVSFQTDEDSPVKGDLPSVMKTIVSDGTPIPALTRAHFTASETVFDAPFAVWSGVWFDGKALFASAGTPSGSSLKKISWESPIL